MRLTVLCLTRKVGDLTIKYSNLPERYIQRCLQKVYWKTPDLPQYQRKVLERKKFHFDVDRPWTLQFQKLNDHQKMHRKIWLEPIKDWSIFKGDRVEILVGKDKGKQGIVAQVIQERNWVIVDGLNAYRTITNKTKDFPGLMVLKEAPLLVTNEVALVDPVDLKPVKVEWRFTEEGEKVRVSERSGRIIPVPVSAEETYDYKSKSLYLEQDKDTKTKEVTDITFKPVLATFEMDIMNEMGIKEDRVEAETYWY